MVNSLSLQPVEFLSDLCAFARANAAFRFNGCHAISLTEMVTSIQGDSILPKNNCGAGNILIVFKLTRKNGKTPQEVADVPGSIRETDAR
ncbi:MAG TPA: hypothetical protein VFG19_11925 [Geobacteraceae bacterium]|nr:hypothetical protein [Geobacteraceae bacterium]